MIQVTSNTNQSAVNQFIAFANNIREDIVDKIENLDEEWLCSKETWQQFAGHLMRMAVSGLIMKGTAEIYLNGAKHAVKEMYKGHATFSDTDWQAKLVLNMTSEIKRKCIVSHIRFEKKKTAPIGMKGLSEISDYLIRQNSKSSIIFNVGFVTCFEFEKYQQRLPHHQLLNCLCSHYLQIKCIA